MHILNSYTLKYLKLNKKRTIVTIIGIILSCAMISGVTTLAASFRDLFIRQAIADGGNYHVAFNKVTYGNSQYITHHTNTKEHMITTDIGYGRLEGLKNPHKPYLYLYGFDSSAFENQPIRIISGRFPQKDGEVVITEHILTNGEVPLKVGDVLTLDIGDRVLDGVILDQSVRYDGPESKEMLIPRIKKTYTIVGIVNRPRFEFHSAPGYSVFAYMDSANLEDDSLVNVSILVKKPKDVYHIAPELAKNADMTAIDDHAYGYDIRFNSELLRWSGISDNIAFNAFIESIALIVIGLIIIGSVTVIYTSFSISVSERKKQFGMLRSVGATATQIRKAVAFEALVVSLIGIPLGIISGIVGISITLRVANNLMKGIFNNMPDLLLVVSPWSVISAVLFMVLTIVISVYIPAKRASMISPVDAIRLNTDIKEKGKIKTNRIARMMFGFEGDLALKSLKRNRKKYATTVFSLFISIVMFISFSTFTMYSTRTNDHYYYDYNYDISLNFSAVGSEYESKFIEGVFNLPQVAKGSAIEVLPTFFYDSGSKISSYALENFDYHFTKNDEGLYEVFTIVAALDNVSFEAYAKEVGLKAEDFRDTNKLNAILINKNVIKDSKIHDFSMLDVLKGDTIELWSIPRPGEEVSVKAEIVVDSLTSKLPVGIRNPDYNTTLVISQDTLEGLKKALNMENTVFSTSLYFKTKDPAGLEKAIRELHLQDPKGEIDIHNVHKNTENNRKMNTLMSIFFYGFISLITLIGVTNIFNTISTNIELRRREFAMLRSVGLTPQGFRKILNYECIFYGIKALAYGLPVSFLTSYLIHNSFGNIFGSAFILPWKAIIACVIAVFAIVFATMLYSSSKLKKDNIVDAIRAENL